MKKFCLVLILSLISLTGCTNQQDYLPGPYKNEDIVTSINESNMNTNSWNNHNLYNNEFGGNI